ncbi:MAG: hypothetical protein J6R05_01630, partial [Bacteroidaceae bacterium]|nr:hypothetical protein [Bacteroidaceae bacterium]
HFVVFPSVSDATLMLDFCEVQHLKLNQQRPCRSSQRAKLHYAVFGSFCSSLLKKNGLAFLT